MILIADTSETGGGKPLSRLFSDTAGELRKFAGRLGLCPKYLRTDAEGEYYLITPGWRSRALREGAKVSDG